MFKFDTGTKVIVTNDQGYKSDGRVLGREVINGNNYYLIDFGTNGRIWYKEGNISLLTSKTETENGLVTDWLVKNAQSSILLKKDTKNMTYLEAIEKIKELESTIYSLKDDKCRVVNVITKTVILDEITKNEDELKRIKDALSRIRVSI